MTRRNFLSRLRNLVAAVSLAPLLLRMKEPVVQELVIERKASQGEQVVREYMVKTYPGMTNYGMDLVAKMFGEAYESGDLWMVVGNNLGSATSSITVRFA